MTRRHILPPLDTLRALLLCLLLAAAGARGDDADDIVKTITRDTPNRAEAARKILDAARSLTDSPGIQIRLCEKAYEHGILSPGGYPTAIAALSLLERVAPTRVEAWREKRLEVYRLQYYRSTKETKADNGLIYIKLLLARARANGKDNNWKDAANCYRQAYQVARTLKLPEKDAIYEDLRMAGSYEMVHNRIEVLRTALNKQPDDLFSRKQLVMACLVDLDNPAGAAKYLSDKSDPALHAHVTRAAKAAADLTGADFFALAAWYRTLSEKATLKHSKIRMLTRALDNLNLYLEVYTTQDAQRLRATTLAALIRAELKELGAEAPAAAVKLPAGLILALAFDTAQWIKSDRGGPQIKDVSGTGKTVRAISAQPEQAGQAGQAARIGKGGGIDLGMILTREPRTFAFWAKADSARQTNVMLLGTISYSGRFYFGYDAQSLLGIGMGAARWANESHGVKLDTAWHHYALTWDGKKVALYLDGRLRASKAERITPQGPLYVAAGASSSRARGGSSRGAARLSYTFIGCIDEVAVFSRVLGESDIQQLVRLGSAGTPLGK